MTYKKTEKEIIKTIVEYGDEVKSLADVINESELLENRGIAILPGIPNYVFLNKEIYEDDEDKNALGYVTELISLIIRLINERLIVPIPLHENKRLVVGKKSSKWDRPEQIMIDNGKEFVVFQNNGADIVNRKGEQLYWPIAWKEQELPISRVFNCWFSISQELKDLVKHHFKTEEQRRFTKQQYLTWISIAAAFAIGIAGIFF